MPVNFINTVTPFESHLIVFCATTLANLAILSALAFVFFRQIKESGLFAPFTEFNDRVKDLFVIGISAGGAYIASFVIKNIFKIPRPFISNPSIHALISETGYGFPSGHATTFMALAVALFFLNRKAGYIFGIIALLIGTARILAGVHTPLDIFAGYVLGVIFAFLVNYVALQIQSNSVE